MKNLKISMKLILSFVIVIVLSVIVAAVGIFGMQSIQKADEDMYNMNLIAVDAIGMIKSQYYDDRVQLRNLILYNAGSDAFQKAMTALEKSPEIMNDLYKTYEATITDDIDRQNFTSLKKTIADFDAMVLQIKPLALADENSQSLDILNTVGTPIAASIEELIAASVKLNDEAAAVAVKDNAGLTTSMVFVEIGVILFTVTVSMVLAFYISGLIAKPVNKMVTAANQIAVGDMDVDVAYDATDEIGVMATAFEKMVQGINQQVAVVQTIASGDLTIEAHPRTPKDLMGVALEKLLESLNNMFGEITNSTSQVSSGSKQIADGAQSLAQGSTEQAAAVEQLSSSISEVAAKTKENANMAEKAASLAGTIKGNAEKGSTQMGQMMQAVKEIGEASNSISKVIKVIDDIAFQTNILALNAAVEAARAGQHGKGFAVVAEEVRNLAAKSADAAKDTGSLIANSMEKAQLGQRIAEETSASLEEIVTGINESSIIVGDIAVSSEEQNLAITQINKGIDQVAQVVQQNSATAEESAAASEEMSGQANVLEDLISQFKLKNASGFAPAIAAPQRTRQLSMPSKTSYAPASSMGDDDFGKY